MSRTIKSQRSIKILQENNADGVAIHIYKLHELCRRPKDKLSMKDKR